MNHEIKNDFLKVKIKSLGAELNSLQKTDENIEYIWQGDEKYWNRHAPILFPIVGKLKDNSYFYSNQKFTMTQHGFARDNEFELIKKENDYLEFKLTNSSESLKKYPFLFNLIITYKLENSKLIITYIVKNLSKDEMFFSIGAHPAFNWPLTSNEKKEDYLIEFENIKNTKRYYLNENGLVHNSDELEIIDNKIDLNEELFKNDALIFNDSKIQEVIFKNFQNTKFIKVNFDSFPYLGIWSKPSGAPFLCIEPWFGIADFENSSQKIQDKKGIIKLKKDETFSCNYSIEV